MGNEGLQPVPAQPAQIADKRTGKSRVKPRHLSRLTRQLILDQFAAVRSSEDVAEAFRLPVRTVSDVIGYEALRRVRALEAMAVRRAA